jgi:radical SAM protein with 4Fe4S-binding SPASM domain
MTYVQKLRHNEHGLWRDSRPILEQIDIELTERCNNNCVHCCINQPEGDRTIAGREMSTDFVKKILTEAAALGCLAVRFTGGEPLLRQDFPELYLFARRLGMQVILFTNARLVNEEIAGLLARVPPRRAMEVSVYGMTPESYDRTAGHRGAFAEFRHGIELLLRHRIPFIVKGPKFHVQEEERKEFEAWAATLPSMDKKPSVSMNFDLRHRRDDPAKNERIRSLRSTPEETVEMLRNDPLYLRETALFCDRFLGQQGAELFNCGAGHGTCIDAYGRAQLCLSLRSPLTVADLHDAPLSQVLEELFPAMLKLEATNPDYLWRCAKCFIKSLCGQCPAKSWAEHGTLDTPVEYLCSVAHAKASFLGLVGEHENAWEVTDWRERVDQLVEAQSPVSAARPHGSATTTDTESQQGE